MPNAYDASGAGNPSGPRVLANVPEPRVSAAEIAQPYQQIARAVGHFGDFIDEATVDWHRQAAEQDILVSRGPDGKSRVEPRPLELTAGDRAYNAVIKQRAFAQGSGEIDRQATDLLAKYPNDPAGFETEARNLVKGLATTGPKELRGALSAYGDKVMSEFRNNLVITKAKSDTAASKADILARAEVEISSLRSLAETGGTGTPQFAEQWKRIEDTFGALAKNPAYAFSKERAEAELARLKDVVTVDAMRPTIDRAFADGGAVLAQEVIRNHISNPGLRVTDQDRSRMGQVLENRLKYLQGERQGQITVFRAFKTQMMDRITKSRDVPDSEVDAAIARANALGDLESAAELGAAAYFSRGRIGRPDGIESLPDAARRQALGLPASGSLTARPAAAAPTIFPDSMERLEEAAKNRPDQPVTQLLGAKDWGDNTAYFTGPDGKPLTARAALAKMRGGAASAGGGGDNGAPAPSGGSDGLESGAFPASLISTESGGRWGASNNVPGSGGTGHFGRLQFSRGRLQAAMEAGAIPQGTTPEEFMRRPDLQRAAEAWHFRDIDRFIVQNSLQKAIGTQIGGTTVTLNGMRAVAHLGGNNGLKQFIESGGAYNPSDANGTSLSDYLRRHGGSGSVAGDGGYAVRTGGGGAPSMPASLASNPYGPAAFLRSLTADEDRHIQTAENLATAALNALKHREAVSKEDLAYLIQARDRFPDKLGAKVGEVVDHYSSTLIARDLLNGSEVVAMNRLREAKDFAAQSGDLHAQKIARFAEEYVNAGIKGMAEDHIAEGAERKWYPRIGPLDFSSPQTIADSVASRSVAVQTIFGNERGQAPMRSVLAKTDADSFAAGMGQAKPAVIASFFESLRLAPEEVREATIADPNVVSTLKALAKTDDPERLSVTMTGLSGLKGAGLARFADAFGQSTLADVLAWETTARYLTKEELQRRQRQPDAAAGPIAKRWQDEASKKAAGTDPSVVASMIAKHSSDLFSMDRIGDRTPQDPMVVQAMVGEFAALTREMVLKTNGDVDKAMAMAAEMQGSVWAVSATNNGKFMRFAPERYLRGPDGKPATINGSYRWIRDQIHETLRERLGIKPPEGDVVDPNTGMVARAVDTVTPYELEYHLVATMKTEAALARGQPLSYALVYKDKTGVFNAIEFTPDIGKAMAPERIRLAEERRRALAFKEEIARSGPMPAGVSGITVPIDSPGAPRLIDVQSMSPPIGPP